MKPPPDYGSWLEYAIATMDARSLHLLSCDDDSPWGRVVQSEEMRNAARDELNKLAARVEYLEQIYFEEGE